MGTKGMNDLISRAALFKAWDALDETQDANLLIDAMIKATQDAPAVDTAEVVRYGQYDDGGDCTVCGYPMPTDDRCDAIFPGEIKYCYNCGAKMVGEVSADD